MSLKLKFVIRELEQKLAEMEAQQDDQVIDAS